MQAGPTYVGCTPLVCCFRQRSHIGRPHTHRYTRSPTIHIYGYRTSPLTLYATTSSSPPMGSTRRPPRARRHTTTTTWTSTTWTSTWTTMSTWADDDDGLPPLKDVAPPPAAVTTTTTSTVPAPKPSTSTTAPAGKSGYVPPHLRGRQAGATSGGERGFGASRDATRVWWDFVCV